MQTENRRKVRSEDFVLYPPEPERGAYKEEKYHYEAEINTWDEEFQEVQLNSFNGNFKSLQQLIMFRTFIDDIINSFAPDFSTEE